VKREFRDPSSPNRYSIFSLTVQSRAVSRNGPELRRHRLSQAPCHDEMAKSTYKFVFFWDGGVTELRGSDGDAV
jgi:hypothetical protein